MKLSHVNNLLIVLIVLVNGYVIVAPFWPQLAFHNHHAQQTQLQHKIDTAKTNSQPAATPQQNSVIIPSMLLDQPIWEGPVSQQYQTLNQGIWRWPAGSTPDQGGNTVLIGHRFTYTNPRGVFYFLNKVGLGDEIGLWWNNKQYIYKVVRIYEVPPTDTSIEANTQQAQLTLFTCTPLWLPRDRLVVVANLETSHE